MSHYQALPKNVEDVARFPYGEVWIWTDDENGRTQYKAYTESRDIAKALMRHEGVRKGADGYPVQAFDFICRAYVMKSVLQLLGYSGQKKRIETPLQNELF